MEIGFGMGFELIAWAEQRPEWRLLGVGLYQPGIGSMLSRLKKKLSNVRLVDCSLPSLYWSRSITTLWEKYIFSSGPVAQEAPLQTAIDSARVFALTSPKTDAYRNRQIGDRLAEYAEWMVKHFAANPGFKLAGRYSRGDTNTAFGRWLMKYQA